MSRARVVRWVVIGVCAVGIAGMIGGSAVDNSDLALTFGLITAAAVLCLMVATAVTAPATTHDAAGAGVFGEGQAARGEHLVGRFGASVASLTVRPKTPCGSSSARLFGSAVAPGNPRKSLTFALQLPMIKAWV